ncbi:hypothetical protein ZTR_04468 [Talaromyces verruculosus]|nr:hypothetical protein ZTR_04468 [Talaromyces verruculosus]
MSANILYQYSLISCLMHEIFSDGVPANEILEKGTHGLGTVAELDGEIVVIDSQAYHFTTTGNVRCLTKNDTVPFAMMTRFQPSTVRYLTCLTQKRLWECLYPLVGPEKNYFLAVQIEARFECLTIRVIPKRNSADETLTALEKRQEMQTVENSTGILFGFWSPEYTQGFSVPGFHLHYLSEDRKIGGHVLDFEALKAKVSAAILKKYHLELPQTEEFQRMGVGIPASHEVESA